MESTLYGGLNLGLGLVKPGSIRWNGDRFTAEYAEPERPVRRSVKILGADGKEAPESVKANVLAQMETDPENRQGKFVLSHGEPRAYCKSATVLETGAVKDPDEVAPGSIEAKIMALWEARERERIRKGIQGRLVRDEGGRVTEIVLQSEPACRVQFGYEDSGDVPPPFPHRIDTFIELAGAAPGVPKSQKIIHSLRLSKKPLEDAVFDPWSRLKPGEFARGTLRPDGTMVASDLEGERLMNEWARKLCLESERKREGKSGAAL
jgi:hypothetical protein